MSSKAVDSVARRLWPHSLTARLTLLYTLSTLVILLLAMVVLRGVLMSSLQRDDNQFLQDKILVLRRILANPSSNMDALHEEVQWEGGVGRHKHYFVRILDAEGREFRVTAGMNTLPVGEKAFPTTASLQDLPVSAKRRCIRGAHCYLLMSAWAGTGTQRFRLELLLDTSHEDGLIAAYTRVLLAVLAAGTLLAAFIGFAATRRGLQPLRKMIHAARGISTQRLDRRLRPAHWLAEFVELGAAFDSMLERLQAGFERLAQSSSELAHELRTPINNLMGELEVALSRTRSAEDYRQVLESNLEECARLASMIQRLLFLARADNGTTAISRQTLDGQAEVAAVCEYFEALAQEKGIELQREGRATPYADPALLRRALGNLLSNALQYTPAGGRICVQLAELRGGGAEIRVLDSGIGIAGQDPVRLFDRFYRSETARRLHPQGTGLGLAIVKSIMTLHRGSVSLAPAPGGGTLVTLVFPPAG